MPTITSYATLTQSILDYAHRPGLSTFTDYFIQAAHEEINNDIFAENFGKGVLYMEANYPATAIDGNGTIIVPSDWLSPKTFTVTAPGGVYDLEFKTPQWIYERYPNRSASGVPVYIARDVSPSYPSVANSTVITATAGQTIFDISVLAGDTVLFANLDGAMLYPTTDYSISGNTLTLVNGATVGQKLYVQANTSLATTSATNLKATATSGQTVFSVATLAGAAILFATLDGAMLVPGVDYSITAETLTLTNGATAGQNLYVQAATLSGADGSSVFIFGPYPDSSYTVQGTYYSKGPLLSASQTTNWMVTNAPSMLLANCMRQAGKFLKDVAMVEGWTQLYQDALTKLIERDAGSRFGEAPLTIRCGDPLASGW